MRRPSGAQAGRFAAACLMLAVALPAQAQTQTYRCSAPGGRTTFQQAPCERPVSPARAAASAPAPKAPPAAANPACAETSAAILGRQAEIRRLEAEGESRAAAQDAFIRPGDNLPTMLPNIRQAYASHIAATQDEIETLRKAARRLACPTH